MLLSVRPRKGDIGFGLVVQAKEKVVRMKNVNQTQLSMINNFERDMF